MIISSGPPSLLSSFSVHCNISLCQCSLLKTTTRTLNADDVDFKKVSRIRKSDKPLSAGQMILSSLIIARKLSFLIHLRFCLHICPFVTVYICNVCNVFDVLICVRSLSICLYGLYTLGPGASDVWLWWIRWNTNPQFKKNKKLYLWLSSAEKHLNMCLAPTPTSSWFRVGQNEKKKMKSFRGSKSSFSSILCFCWNSFHLSCP